MIDAGDRVRAICDAVLDAAHEAAKIEHASPDEVAGGLALAVAAYCSVKRINAATARGAIELGLRLAGVD